TGLRGLGKTVETCRRIAFAIGDQTLAKSPSRAARGRLTNAAACRRPLMRGQKPRGLARASQRRRGGARLSCKRRADLTIRPALHRAGFFEQKARGRNAMTEKWKEESWAQDFWYSGKTTRRTVVGWGVKAGALGAAMLIPAPWRAAFGAAKAYKIGSEQP